MAMTRAQMVAAWKAAAPTSLTPPDEIDVFKAKLSAAVKKAAPKRVADPLEAIDKEIARMLANETSDELTKAEAEIDAIIDDSERHRAERHGYEFQSERQRKFRQKVSFWLASCGLSKDQTDRVLALPSFRLTLEACDATGFISDVSAFQHRNDLGFTPSVNLRDPKEKMALMILLRDF